MEPTNFTNSGFYNRDFYHKVTEKTFQFNDEEVPFELNDLYTYDFDLIKPIAVKLRYNYDDQTFIFTQDELNLWGEGPTLKEAERELASAILSLYKRLASTDRDKLGSYPLELLNYLKQFISSEVK